MMRTKQRGRDSGTFPIKVLTHVEHEGLQIVLSIDEILSSIDPEQLKSLTPRKSFSVIAPKGTTRDEALELLRKKSFVVEEYPRDIWIRIIPLNLSSQ